MDFEVVCEGLAFPEGPRWRDGALWFSDMHAHEVIRISPGSPPEVVVEVPGAPSGLGFLPDGRLLIASMHDRSVMRLDDGVLVQHADLSGLATWHVNDLLADTAGRAYVGNFGDASIPPDPPAPATLALVHPDGTVQPAAEHLGFPNGMALIHGGATLVVAETRATPPRLSAFDVDTRTGRLSNRRMLVAFDGQLPDGICADSSDHIWVASPFTGELLRVSPSGAVVESRACPRPPYACALGGHDGRTLFVCTALSWEQDEALRTRSGQILATTVTVGR